MRPLAVTFPENAEIELKELLKKEKDIRVFRRAQAILAVVKGKRAKEASATFRIAYSELRKWIYRYANGGIENLKDRKRSGRPREMTPEIEELIIQLLSEDPLDHRSTYSQWNCRELARVVGEKTGRFFVRESIRKVLKKRV